MALLKKKKRVSEIPTSSLADIAFLLLIFFLVSTTIDMDKGLGLILPAEGQEIKVRKEKSYWIKRRLILKTLSPLLKQCWPEIPN